jgi:hypothetical protein
MNFLRVELVGASGFEPPASWSRTRFPAFLPRSTVSYLLLQSTSYQDAVENGGTPNSSGVGTKLGTTAPEGPTPKTAPARVIEIYGTGLDVPGGHQFAHLASQGSAPMNVGQHAGPPGPPLVPARRAWKYQEKVDEFSRSHRDGRYAPDYFTMLEREMRDPKLLAEQRFIAGMKRFAWGNLSDVAVDCMPALGPDDPKPRPLTQAEFARRTGMSEGAVSECATFYRSAGYLRADHPHLYLEDQGPISASETNASESVNFTAVRPDSMNCETNPVGGNPGAVPSDSVNNRSITCPGAAPV